MRKTFIALMALAMGFAILAIAPAQAAPEKQNHGQCVSQSPQPEGKGGRSAVAKDKGACAPAPTPVIDCTEYGGVGTRQVDSTTNTVTLSADAATGGSSLECSGLAVPVLTGQLVTFDYTLEGAVCGGGVPRVFLVIDGNGYNTFDDYKSDPLPGACGTGGAVGEATAGTVSYDIKEDGTLTDLGLVFDKESGSATYSNLRVDGVVVDF